MTNIFLRFCILLVVDGDDDSRPQKGRLTNGPPQRFVHGIT